MTSGVTNPDEVAARAKLAALVQEHRDLDAAIEALSQSGVPDQFAMARLKKRKLQLNPASVRCCGAPSSTSWRSSSTSSKAR